MPGVNTMLLNDFHTALAYSTLLNRVCRPPKTGMLCNEYFAWNVKFDLSVVYRGRLDNPIKGIEVDDIRDLKRDDTFNKTWWPAFSIDKCCQVTSLSIERTDHHVLFS